MRRAKGRNEGRVRCDLTPVCRAAKFLPFRWLGGEHIICKGSQPQINFTTVKTGIVTCYHTTEQKEEGAEEEQWRPPRSNFVGKGRREREERKRVTVIPRCDSLNFSVTVALPATESPVTRSSRFYDLLSRTRSAASRSYQLSEH